MKQVLILGFDIEEFDLPLECNRDISFEEQLNVSTEGTNVILDILAEFKIKATFFCTANYAINRPELIHRIIDEGHELASHGYFHSEFKPEDYQRSKDTLETLSGSTVKGFRMARMQPIDTALLSAAGYTYDTSINPTWIPGRYNNRSYPFGWHKLANGLVEIPSAVTPFLRLPLFWLSFHLLPVRVFTWLVNRLLRKQDYAVIYFHPWEFVNLQNHSEWNIPIYIRYNSGDAMRKRLSKMIKYYKSNGIGFESTASYFEKKKVL